MIKTNKFWWHNYIDGSVSTKEMKRQAEFCLMLVLMLDDAVRANVVKITNSDCQPSFTAWDVLDDEAYEKLCKKRGLDPKAFVMEFDEEE